MERLAQSVEHRGAWIDLNPIGLPFTFSVTGTAPGIGRASGAPTSCAVAPSVATVVVTAAAVVATPVALARDKKERLLSFSRVVMRFGSSSPDGILSVLLLVES